MKSFIALALASVAGNALSALNGGHLTRSEFIMLIALLPVFRLAIAQVLEHHTEYAEISVEILQGIRSGIGKFLHRVRTYDYRALAIRTFYAIVNLGINLWKAAVALGKFTIQAVKWTVATIKAADIPARVNQMHDSIIAAQIPVKIRTYASPYIGKFLGLCKRIPVKNLSLPKLTSVKFRSRNIRNFWRTIKPENE